MLIPRGWSRANSIVDAIHRTCRIGSGQRTGTPLRPAATLGEPSLPPGSSRGGRQVHPSALTAFAITSAAVTSEIADSSSIASFAQRDSGSVSVGLNAVALVNATYR